MEQQDNFLEYCSGKVFLISWINDSGDEVTDRWVAFGKDSEIALNYLKSSDPERIELVRFKPYSYLNETEYEVAFALNSELDINQVGFIVGEIFIFKAKGQGNLLQQVINHINKIVYGEDCGN